MTRKCFYVLLGVGCLFWAMTMVCVVSAGDNPQGKPFKKLQKQIDEVKSQLEDIQQAGVVGYKQVEGTCSAGRYPDLVYGCSVTCPLGMKPVGGGGKAIAHENGSELYDVFLMTESKPFEYVCEFPGDGGPPNTYYGWEVSWLNIYSGNASYVSSDLKVYVICVGTEQLDPGCY